MHKWGIGGKAFRGRTKDSLFTPIRAVRPQNALPNPELERNGNDHTPKS